MACASERRGADAPSGRLSTELVSRHGLLAGGFLAASAIVLARLSEIQVFNTDWYREQANARRVSSQTLYAKRGTIYDRNGTVLVSSIECKNVYLNPSLIKKKQRRGADAPSGRLSTELVSRHGLLAGGFLAASAIVLARLSEIQVFNTDWYREQANARRVSSQTLYAKRGTIYDRNGTVLVSSIECKNVYLNPSLIKKKQRRRAIDALVDVLGMDEDVVEDLVDREGTFVYVKRQVDEEDAELLAKKGIAGIEFEPAIKRVYPNGSLASQVLGVVNVSSGRSMRRMRSSLPRRASRASNSSRRLSACIPTAVSPPRCSAS